MQTNVLKPCERSLAPDEQLMLCGTSRHATLTLGWCVTVQASTLQHDQAVIDQGLLYNGCDQ